jgi:hypothetical protein
MSRRLSTSAVVGVALIALGPIAASGQTLTYDHQGSPLFSVTFPAGWLIDLDFGEEARQAGAYTEGVEPALRIVEARPTDGRKVWVGLWAVPEVETLDDGVAYFGSLRQELFTDLELAKPDKAELGGMPARVTRGTARREGEAVELSLALFVPRQGRVAAALYVGAPEAWRAHAAELEKMVASLRPAK